jgi:hypothetical protein
VNNLDFCPYEDVLGIGHSQGVSSILIPGSGNPNFDSKNPNPFSTDKHIMDWNVRMLLDKIPWETISLDPSVIGTSGQREKDYKYNKNVKISDELKQMMNRLGIKEQKSTQKITDREELRKVLEKHDEERKKQYTQEPWYKNENNDALERFGPKSKKKKEQKVEVQKEKEDQKKEEQKKEEQNVKQEEKKKQKSKRKVKVCEEFVRTGKCRFGTLCIFRHPGTSHMGAKEKICRQWYETGKCPLGKKCKFAHPGEDKKEDHKTNKKRKKSETNGKPKSNEPKEKKRKIVEKQD